MLKGHAIAINMDGKGRWVDNVFVEGLWRSVKYEDVSLRAYETTTELRTGLARYFGFYNTTSLENRICASRTRRRELRRDQAARARSASPPPPARQRSISVAFSASASSTARALT